MLYYAQELKCVPFLVRGKIKKKSKSFECTHLHVAVCKIYYFHIYFGSSIKKAQNIFNDCAINEQHKAPDFCTFQCTNLKNYINKSTTSVIIQTVFLYYFPLNPKLNMNSKLSSLKWEFLKERRINFSVIHIIADLNYGEID